jgi:hypothetical protein
VIVIRLTAFEPPEVAVNFREHRYQPFPSDDIEPAPAVPADTVPADKSKFA